MALLAGPAVVESAAEDGGHDEGRVGTGCGDAVRLPLRGGGAWDVPTIGGRHVEGTIAKGVRQFFVTELLDIDVLNPRGEAPNPHAAQFPENRYRSVTT